MVLRSNAPCVTAILNDVQSSNRSLYTLLLLNRHSGKCPVVGVRILELSGIIPLFLSGIPAKMLLEIQMGKKKRE